MTSKRFTSCALTAGVFMACATFGTLQAQQPGGPPPPQQQGHGAQGRPGPGGRDDMRILPPGAWWTNPDVIAKIGLTPEQRSHIDGIFSQSRVQLAKLHESLEELEITLEPLLDANPVDQGKALAQINRIADQRAELEKANAKMLLGIRSVLTADQWTKLRSGPHPPPPGR